MKNTGINYLLLITVILSMSAPLKSNGQVALLVLIFGDRIASEEFHLSIEGGLNISGLNQDFFKSTDVGFSFGLGSFIKINDKFAFTPEFKALSQQKVKLNSPIVTYAGFEDAKYSLSMNYIDLPVIFRYKISEKIFISSGIQISYLVGATQRAEGNLNDNNIVLSRKLKKEFNPMAANFLIEAAYSMKNVVAGQGLNFRLRYSHGLTRLLPEGEKMSTSTLGLICSFPFIKD